MAPSNMGHAYVIIAQTKIAKMSIWMMSVRLKFTLVS